MTEVTDPRSISFRGSAFAFAVMTLGVVALAAAGLVLLDPRAQAFWGAKFSDLGAAAQAMLQLILSLLPRSR